MIQTCLPSEGHSINISRRFELLLLCLVALVAGVGALQVCHAFGLSLHHASRLVLVPAALLLITFLLDYLSPHRDHILLPCVGGLSALGLVLLWRLELGGSVPAGTRQTWWMLLGLGVLVTTYGWVRDVRRLAQYKYVCGISAVALIGATMAWGHEVNGARLWLGIPGLLTFQPTELAKILLCIFLAGYIAAKGDMLVAQGSPFLGVSIPNLRYIAPLVGLVLFSLTVFVCQRDLGAAVLLFGVFMAMLYLATGRRVYVLLGTLLFVGGGIVAGEMFPHVHRRLEAWLNPWADPNGSGYQILQSLFCYAEGGLFGQGLGGGFPSYVPAAHTDLILAVGAEELGLAGVIILVLLASLVSYRGYAIAWSSRDRFGSLLAAALSTTLALQTLVIIGGSVKLIPLTGITFPFVSYGGSSVLSSFVIIGLLLCVSRDCVQQKLSGPASASVRAVQISP